ncbi:TrmB family transcriptional regulator [Candidatus Woesearchaeota archaeon]|nr:TrmB family transcriptional regulator [Candidatus Woesearchaeota archaeon]
MIIQKEFLAKIKHNFRLNIYEVKIWTSLLSRGIATAGELADISGVPRSRCYDVLESLEKKGFIIMKIGRPIKYIAVKPEEIIERVKKNLKEESDIQTRILETIGETDVFRELELLHKTGIEKVNAVKLSNSIIGRDELYRFIKSFVEKANKNITIATTADGFLRKTTLLKNSIKNLSKRGVKIKIVAPIDKKIGKKIEGSVELRDIDPGVRFVAIDNKELLFMLSDDKINPNYDGGVWIDSPFFVDALDALFSNTIK